MTNNEQLVARVVAMNSLNPDMDREERLNEVLEDVTDSTPSSAEDRDLVRQAQNARHLA